MTQQNAATTARDAADAIPPGTISPATIPLVAALVDDAGLFPPTALDMTDAVARHRADDAAGNPVHTGRFLVPTSRVDELRQALREGESVQVGLIVDEPLADLAALVTELAADPRLRLAGIELRLPAGDLAEAVACVQAATQGTGAATFVEIPLAGAEAGATAQALRAVHAAGLGAKVRCGGVTPELFPTADELADFLVLAVELGTAFKCTAGLHHAVRYVDERTGFQHHGVLDILVAVLRARSGAGREAVVEALTCDDGDALAAEARAASEADQRAARASFTAYGSCSTSTPVDDLVALGFTTPVEGPEIRDPEQQLDHP
ncbi:hypothetical protein [Arsenicicoccus dermatophilus]|uniref:hypothetical protein n=1 Tax=Arsenicicoccus dermatophilus TaxID=1076331 RepID=UPI001F4C9B06|nr:hypothetical protein [Arsenicicoccus dermatophilus]MCH8614335.1 hypothetical protein [Arsenicicoccus dermatophilus]